MASPEQRARERRILLVGVTGQVGWELQRTLRPLGRVYGTARQAAAHAGLVPARPIDLTDAIALRELIREIRPDWIVNAAAYTAVDQAEREEALALAINGTAPAIMAEEAQRIGAALIHYSTDYVYGGSKAEAYSEEDPTDPRNAYARTKLAGDEAIRQSGAAHIIFRIGWVYGLRGRNFLRTILRLARECPEIPVVNDQAGTPTWSRMVAEATFQVLANLAADPSWLPQDRSGIYHLSSGERVTWNQFAQAIVDRAAGEFEGPPPRIRPIPSEEYPTPAVRPKNSVLSPLKLLRTFAVQLPPWDAALSLCLAEKAPPG